MADDPMQSVPTDPAHRSYAGVEALLAEVAALSIRLNQVGRGGDARNNLPAAAYGALQALERHGPQTVPQIARRRSTSRQNIQILINRLEAQGCVGLSVNPAHRRSALVGLTQRGRALLSQGAKVHSKLLETLAASISEPELSGAARVLSGIRRLLPGEKTHTSEDLHPRKAPRSRSQRLPAKSPEKKNPAVGGAVPASAVAEKGSADDEEFPVSLL